MPFPYGYGKNLLYGVKRGLEMVCRFRTDTVKISVYGSKHDMGKGMPFPYGYGKNFGVYGQTRHGKWGTISVRIR